MTPDLKQRIDTLFDALTNLFKRDASFIAKRDAHYESSWKKRGGVGAMLTIARPWDRFEAIAKRDGWDIFKTLQAEIDAGKTEGDDGTLQACIRDLRAYMALLAVHTQEMRQVYKQPPSLEMGVEHFAGGVVPANKHQENAHTSNSKAAEDIFPSPREQRQGIKDVLRAALGKCGQDSSPLAMTIDQLLCLIETL